MFQPTPRKCDAGTTAPRRLLRAARDHVVVVDDDAFAVDGDVARRDTDTTRVEFLSAARAKLAETMECALSPGFRRVRSRGRDAAAEDVDVVGANLAVAAKAMGVTLVGHSVSFDTVGKRTTFGRADATASERTSERASGRGDECETPATTPATRLARRRERGKTNARNARGGGRLGERYRDARLGDERRSGASVAARSDWTRSGRSTHAREGEDDVVEGWETRGTRGGSDGAHGDVGVAGEERDGGRVRVRFAGARGWVRFAARDAVAAREETLCDEN